MAGRIYKRGNVWYADLRDGRNGFRQRLRGGPRRADAQHLLDEFNANLRLGLKGADTMVKVADLVNGYLADRRGTGLAPRSLRRYEFAARHLCRVLGPLVVADLGPGELRRYEEDRVRGGASPSSVRKEVKLLRRVLRRAEEEGTIGRDPVRAFRPSIADRPKRRRLVPTFEEAFTIIEAAPPRWRRVLTFLAFTAVRVSAVLALRWRDLHLEAEAPFARVGADKTESGARDVLLAPPVLEALGAPGKPADFVFPGGKGADPTRALHISAVWQAFKVAVAAAGVQVPEGATLTTHCLKKFAATSWLEAHANPADLAALAGHHSASVTLKYYTASRVEGQRAAVAAMADRWEQLRRRHTTGTTGPNMSNGVGPSAPPEHTAKLLENPARPHEINDAGRSDAGTLCPVSTVIRGENPGRGCLKAGANTATAGDAAPGDGGNPVPAAAGNPLLADALRLLEVANGRAPALVEGAVALLAGCPEAASALELCRMALTSDRPGPLTAGAAAIVRGLLASR